MVEGADAARRKVDASCPQTAYAFRIRVAHGFLEVARRAEYPRRFVNAAQNTRVADIFSAVTRPDVEQALGDLDNGVPHPFGPSSTFDLLYEGRRYPPKAVIGLAAKHQNGVELAPGDFPGGEGTAAFDRLRA